MRFFLFQLVLIFLPFLAYRLYLNFVVAKKVEEGDAFSEVRTSWLFAAGLILALLSLVIAGLTGEKVTEGTYKPPTLEDGKVVPPKID